MRVNWIIASGFSPTMNAIYDACGEFYSKYGVVPDTVKMTYRNIQHMLSHVTSTNIHVLERGKEYGHFIHIPGGMVEICILDDAEYTVDPSGGSLIVVESKMVDREFEKHVLGNKP